MAHGGSRASGGDLLAAVFLGVHLTIRHSAGRKQRSFAIGLNVCVYMIFVVVAYIQRAGNDTLTLLRASFKETPAAAARHEPPPHLHQRALAPLADTGPGHTVNRTGELHHYLDVDADVEVDATQASLSISTPNDEAPLGGCAPVWMGHGLFGERNSSTYAYEDACAHQLRTDNSRSCPKDDLQQR